MGYFSDIIADSRTGIGRNLASEATPDAASPHEPPSSVPSPVDPMPAQPAVAVLPMAVQTMDPEVDDALPPMKLSAMPLSRAELTLPDVILQSYLKPPAKGEEGPPAWVPEARMVKPVRLPETGVEARDRPAAEAQDASPGRREVPTGARAVDPPQYSDRQIHEQLPLPQTQHNDASATIPLRTTLSDAPGDAPAEVASVDTAMPARPSEAEVVLPQSELPVAALGVQLHDPALTQPSVERPQAMDASRGNPSYDSVGPRLQVGVVNVIVEGPVEPAKPAVATGEHNFASRNFLRSL